MTSFHLNVVWPDGRAALCPQCRQRMSFCRFDEQARQEVYQCKNGHVTLLPEVGNAKRA